MFEQPVLLLVKHSTTKECFILNLQCVDFKMSREPGFVNEQSAVLTYTGRLTAIAWREHLEEKWQTFQGHLPEIKLPIICGVHGGENGSYGGDASNFETCMGQAVSITKYILSTYLHSTY